MENNEFNDIPKGTEVFTSKEPPTPRLILVDFIKHISVKEIFILLLALVFSVTFGILIFYAESGYHDNNINTKVSELNKELKNIKYLEDYLTKTQSDLIRLQEEKAQLEEQLKSVTELKNMSDDQIEAIKLTLKSKSLKDSLYEYLVGILIGILSSLIGSLIIDYVKRKKINKPNQEGTKGENLQNL